MEVELKLLLEQGDADRLRARLGPPLRTEEQTNRYFDDDARTLGRAGWGLRLREASRDGGAVHWTLTLKHSGDESGEFSVRPEYETALEPGEVDPIAVARGLLDDPGALPDVAVTEIGRMHNHRECYLLAGTDFTVELDHTRWPDGSESDELELEIDDASRDAEASGILRAYFEELGIAWRVGRVSKLARLIRML